MENNDKLNKHEKRLLKKQKRLEQRELQTGLSRRAIQKKRLFSYSIVIIILVLISIFGFRYLSNFKYTEAYTKQAVHWHADINIETCGINRDLPKSTLNTRIHGEQFLGTQSLHTHDDNIAHMEGLFIKPEDISLGRFFDVIGVKFSETEIMEYKNGNMCSNVEKNKVRLFINDKENFEFRDYIMKDGDEINIKYE